MWNRLGPGIQSASPELAGGFLAPGPPGSPSSTCCLLDKRLLSRCWALQILTGPREAAQHGLTPGECDEKRAEMETGQVPVSWTGAWEAAGSTSEAFCHSGFFPFWIHPPPSAPGHGSLLVRLPPCSRRFLSLVCRLLFTSTTSDVAASQVPVPGPLLFPTCPPQW